MMIEKRPSERSEAVAKVAAESLLSDVIEWLVQGGDDSAADERDYIRDQLASAMRFDADGFKIAKHLDDDGWDCDARLVEILDGALWKRSEAHDAAVAEWLKRNDIKPPLNLGARVTFKDDFKSKTIEGEITAIDEKRGTFTVFCQSLGHVRKGTGTHGRVLCWEDVSPVESAVRQ